MASTVTLTSLAMLKVNVDQGKDYLDYLRPFILQVLVDHRQDSVTEEVVRDYIRVEFGLEIPERALQIVLKRLSRNYPLKKAEGVYHITGDLPDPGIAVEKSKAGRHIHSVVSGLIEFSKSTQTPIVSTEDAVAAICTFLAEFEIPCLRAYLRGTAIPTSTNKRDSDVVLVSEYVLRLQQTSPERFESFLIMVQGHMLANALLCPDLQNAPKTFKGVTFYLDTPLLIRRLGLEGEPKQLAIEALVRLLHRLGATVAAFSHSRDELENVVKGAVEHLEAPNGRGTVVMVARQNGTTKSDLILLAGQIDDRLAEAKIEVKRTPRYIADLQIDQETFEEFLDDEVSYLNPRAREYDVNSVRSIYVLRKGKSPRNVETCRAVLVSSNAGFARAAWEYGQKYEESREVSSVITDFSLANIAWLKAPMGAPSLPMEEILAFSYAALQPSNELLDKYLSEIDKLEKQGKITARDHQLLRSSTLAQEELMYLTLGDENTLTDETITETLKRVSNEIKKEEFEKLITEQEAHRRTREELESQRAEKISLQERLYWRCRNKAKYYALMPSVLIALLIVVGLVAGLGVRSNNQILGCILITGAGVLLLLTLANLIFGSSVKDFNNRIQGRCLTWLIKREAAAMGLDLSDFRWLTDINAGSKRKK
jgi:hypothetical protein